MTHADQIIRAVAILAGDDPHAVFTREEIRHQIGVDSDTWNRSYSPTFQAMRADQPGGAPPIGDRYRNVFRQVAHGRHTLTDLGRRIVATARESLSTYSAPPSRKTSAAEPRSPLTAPARPVAGGRQMLLELGFERAGQWEAVDGLPVVALDRFGSESSILYAFVSGDEVLYIGKSIRTLSVRLYGYQNPGPTQGTNIVNHARLRDSLQQGKRIDILAFVPRETMTYHGYPVNLAAGLEDVLISRLAPVWNRAGKPAGSSALQGSAAGDRSAT